MAETQRDPEGKISKPIIPIITVPQPLFPASNRCQNVDPQSELEIYKREYSRLLRDNERLLAQLNKVIYEKDDLEKKYNSLQVI